MGIDISAYNTVADRIAEFRDRYPDGSLQPVDPADPFQITTVADRTFITYKAAAYRSPDDERPGIGVAWEPFPGKTPYTKDSELQNAETSAWGRAIVAALASDTRKGIASQEDVRNRQAADQADWEAAQPAQPEQVTLFDTLLERIKAANTADEITAVGKDVHAAQESSQILKIHYDRLARAASHRLGELRQAGDAA